MQWIFFAIVAVAGFVLLVRRERDYADGDAPAAVPPTENRPPVRTWRNLHERAPVRARIGRMDLGLTDRVFVVTGGSRGLGLASAPRRSSPRARTSSSSRATSRALDEAVARARRRRPRRRAVRPTSPTPATAERVIAAAVARYGRLDGALISVGGPAAGTPMTTDDETWRIVVRDRLPRRAARRPRRGQRDELASRATGRHRRLARLRALDAAPASSSRGSRRSNGLRPGLAMMVKDLADELGARGIRVNGLLPGRIATDRMFALDARYGAPDMVRRRNEAAIPLGRYGEPEEFGRVAAFLLSPAASYISGALLPVDGGVAARSRLSRRRSGQTPAGWSSCVANWVR